MLPMTTPPVTRQGQIEHILTLLSHDQLQSFVLAKALQDADFRDTLLIQFADLLSPDEPAESRYCQMLTTLLQRHTGADGYIAATRVNQVIQPLQQLLAVAQKATTPPRITVDLCLAIMTTLPVLIQRMDDHAEHAYDLLHTTCNTLWECSSSLPAERQQRLFERMLQEYANPLYFEMDMDSALLALLKEWSKYNPIRQTACLRQLEQLLKSAQPERWSKPYLLEQVRLLLREWKRQG